MSQAMSIAKLRGTCLCILAGVVVLFFITQPVKLARNAKARTIARDVAPAPTTSAPAAAVSAAAASPPAAAAVHACRDSLERLNGVFREIYADARAEGLAASGPVIVATGDELVLIDDGKPVRATVVPPEYHALKAVAHAPLGMYVLLRDHAGQPLDAADMAKIARFRDAMTAARESLNAGAFPPDQLPAQQAMLDRCLALADSLRQGDTFPSDRLIEFCRGEAPSIWDGVDLSARLEIAGLDKQVRAWREELGPEQWSRLHVVVMGMHTPRVDNLTMQYFRYVLGPDVDDKRLVYAEGAREEERALQTLGTVLLDTGVGAFFFDDPSRMMRDLLGDAAAAYLRTLPKFEPATTGTH
jgi:hypothetical protein